MGVTITIKKNQVFIAYSAAKQRKLFAVRPTIKVSPEEIDLTNNTVFKGKRKDKHLTAILQNQYNWFNDTVSRLEVFEKKVASVSIISKLYEEEFINSSKPRNTFVQDIEVNFNNYITYKRAVEGLEGNSLRGYDQTFRNRFSKFLSAYKYTSVEEIDKDFVIRFDNFFGNTLDLSKASSTLCVAILKNFLKHLYKEKIIDADTFQIGVHNLKDKPYENHSDFALTLLEVKGFYRFENLPKTQMRNKDIFVFNCVAGGLRWSDVEKLKLNDIDFENKLINVYTKKNKASISIPLLPLAEKIIRKYNSDISEKNKKVFDVTRHNSFNHSLKLTAKRFYNFNEAGEKIYPYHGLKHKLIETVNKKTEVVTNLSTNFLSLPYAEGPSSPF